MIYNLGSINIDHFYRLPHLVGSGETLAASDHVTGLGGKGANQSVAAAQSGANVRHIGAVGPDGADMVEKLAAFGVDTSHIGEVSAPTAHAIVMIDTNGENQIVIYSGANRMQDANVITNCMAKAAPGDWLMLQNETSHQVHAAKAAKAAGLNVVYSAAPFDQAAVQDILPFTDLLIMNQVEADQLSQALDSPLAKLPVAHILITKGPGGADWHDTKTQEIVSIPAFSVTPVDTTGAGDTFAGYMVAGLAAGLSPQKAGRRAAAAAAISVTRNGTADAIPSLAEVEAFLA